MDRQQGWLLEHSEIREMKYQAVRPFAYSKQYQLKCQRNGQYLGQLKWYSYGIVGRYGLYSIANNLHYKACHAPLKYQLRWRACWQRLISNHKI